MTEIVGCILTYESIDTIKKTIDTTRRFVDRYVIVDGVIPEVIGYQYPDINVPSLPPVSTDGTLEFLWDLIHETKQKIDIIGTDNHWKHETEARNKFWEKVGEGNWAFIIDSDEYLVINDDEGVEGWREAVLREKAPSIGVTVRQTPGKSSRQMVRLYKNINGVHYHEGNHAHVTDKNEKDITSMAPWYTHVVIVNDISRRFD